MPILAWKKAIRCATKEAHQAVTRRIAHAAFALSLGKVDN